MNTLNLTNSDSSSSAPQQSVKSVFQYSLSITDKNGDIQHLTPAFTSVPSSADISDYLSGWTKWGYSLSSPPQLIKAC